MSGGGSGLWKGSCCWSWISLISECMVAYSSLWCTLAHFTHSLQHTRVLQPHRELFSTSDGVKYGLRLLRQLTSVSTLGRYVQHIELLSADLLFSHMCVLVREFRNTRRLIFKRCVLGGFCLAFLNAFAAFLACMPSIPFLHFLAVCELTHLNSIHALFT